MVPDTPRINKAHGRLCTRTGHDWYLVQLKPNSLAIVQRNLLLQNFQIFAPRRRETRRLGARFRTDAYPLFPGYLFIALDLAASHWRAVNNTVGVTRIVAFGGKPAVVPQALVEQIAMGCDPDGIMRPPEELGPGDRVLVTDGPFAGLLAAVDHCEPDRRIWILMDVMGQATRLQVSRDSVKRS